MKEKWDSRYWELAKFASDWSKDPNAKVGAIITRNNGGVIALGYNGFPSGVEDNVERLTNNDIKLQIIIHAEENALLIAGNAAQASQIFVWGKPICSRCACSIIQAGISRVVSMNPENIDKESKWYESGIIAIRLFEEAGVKVHFMSDNDG